MTKKRNSNLGTEYNLSSMCPGRSRPFIIGLSIIGMLRFAYFDFANASNLVMIVRRENASHFANSFVQMDLTSAAALSIKFKKKT